MGRVPMPSKLLISSPWIRQTGNLFSRALQDDRVSPFILYLSHFPLFPLFLLHRILSTWSSRGRSCFFLALLDRSTAALSNVMAKRKVIAEELLARAEDNGYKEELIET